MNPTCPECGEILTLDVVGEVVFDYAPSAPPLMRSYLALHGAQAPIWDCFGCGGFWAPATF